MEFRSQFLAQALSVGLDAAASGQQDHSVIMPGNDNCGACELS
jgi:hypothetical protein